MINLKHLLSLSVILLTCTICAMQEQDKENKNKTVQELLTALKAQQPQLSPRPSTPLNPGNNAHLPYINVLQTADGRQVTRADVYEYIGICIN